MKYLSYVDFAKEIQEIYRVLSKVIKKLEPEPAYLKSTSISGYPLFHHFKHNQEIEMSVHEILEYGIGEIQVSYGNVDTVNSNYEQIENKEFQDQFNRIWEGFIEYFKAPEQIKKNENYQMSKAKKSLTERPKRVKKYP